MKILIHGINFVPELAGIGKYTGEMALWLAKRGHEVRVVTAPPYYPEWCVEKGFSSWRYQRENIGNVVVFRSPLFVPRQPNTITRLMHLISFAIGSTPQMIRQIFW